MMKVNMCTPVLVKWSSAESCCSPSVSLMMKWGFFVILLVDL